MSVCVLVLNVPCCPPHGSLLSLQSSFLSRGQVLVSGHCQLGALHPKSLLMSALCFGCADGSCCLSGVRWDQTGETVSGYENNQRATVETVYTTQLPGHGVWPLLHPEAVFQ